VLDARRRLLEVAGHLHEADEVGAGPRGDDAYGGLAVDGPPRAGMEEAAADLVERAVAADADEQVEAVAQQLAGQLGRLARLLGEAVLELAEMRADGLLDGLPAPAGAAAGRGGVDDDVDLVIHGLRARRDAGAGGRPGRPGR